MITAADRYRRLAQRLSDIAEIVPEHAWASPSPCEGWTALDVLHHVATTELDLLGRMPFSPVEHIATADARARWPVVRDLVQHALDTPDQAGHEYDGYFGPTTFEATIDHFYNTDLVVHAWDIARAAGLHSYEAIAADEMVRIRSDFGPQFTDLMRTPGIFGPEVAVGANASEQDRFLAWLGRNPT